MNQKELTDNISEWENKWKEPLTEESLNRLILNRLLPNFKFKGVGNIDYKINNIVKANNSNGLTFDLLITKINEKLEDLKIGIVKLSV